jgi:hypothetical protein
MVRAPARICNRWNRMAWPGPAAPAGAACLNSDQALRWSRTLTRRLTKARATNNSASP